MIQGLLQFLGGLAGFALAITCVWFLCVRNGYGQMWCGEKNYQKLFIPIGILYVIVGVFMR